MLKSKILTFKEKYIFLPQSIYHKEKIINSIIFKSKTFVHQVIKKSEKTFHYLGKIFVKHITSKVLVPRIYEESPQSMRQRLTAQHKGKRDDQALFFFRHFLRKKIQAASKNFKNVSSQL